MIVGDPGPRGPSGDKGDSDLVGPQGKPGKEQGNTLMKSCSYYDINTITAFYNLTQETKASLVIREMMGKRAKMEGKETKANLAAI